MRRPSMQSGILAVVLEGYPTELPSRAFSIYVCSAALPNFVTHMLPHITHPFVLVSGDCNEDIPFDVFSNTNQFTKLKEEEMVEFEARLMLEKQERHRAGAHGQDHVDFRSLLATPKLLHWFCQNWCGGKHKKVTSIPIGLDYHTMASKVKWGPSWLSCAEQERQIMEIRESSKPSWERSAKVYGNFHFGNLDAKFVVFKTRHPIVSHSYDRRDAHLLCSDKVMEYEAEPLARVDTWRRQSQFAFVASPHGCGLDCHRTWEALVLGCIPIVKRSKLDVLFEDLPVLVVDSWDQLTPDLLQQTIQDMKSKTFNQHKLFLSYWSNLIKSHLL